ncbi:MAG: VWA domain-containing protein [Oscillospiraceae bacterium]|nr:VWA domain-containing protein [Oscillospiraceae bacterium]
MNKNLTEMVFILDRSGSMQGLEADTIGGYNSLLEKQKNVVGEAAVTTVLFDDRYEMLHDHAGIAKVDPMTARDYYARGMTALLDAVGKTINHVGNRHKYAPDSEVPSKTVVVIITDGHENASREFSLKQIKAMIERQKSKYGWEFLFLGANIDAVSAAADIGISADRSVNYRADSEGTAENFSSVSDAVRSVRCAMPIDGSWKDRIERHFRETEK